MRYQIQGDTLPVVICQLEAGERMITEGGGMSWMSPNMKMETTTNGGIGKAVGRMFSGEKMFQNIYTAQGGNGMIAFASCFPGSIRAFNMSNSIVLPSVRCDSFYYDFTYSIILSAIFWICIDPSLLIVILSCSS